VEHAVFAVVPMVVVAVALWYAYRGGYDAGDFRHSFYLAGTRLLHGGNLYAWTRKDWAAGVSFPYPALTALLVAPATLVSAHLAGSLFMVFCLAAVPLTLWLLDVRDWRVYGIAMLWCPVVIGWQTANLTLPILLGTAVVWRWRDEPRRCGILVALLISLKPIALPLGLFLIASRRYRASAWSLGTGIALGAVSWSVVGWPALTEWLRLVSSQSRILYRSGYSLISLMAHAGVSRGSATILQITAAAIFLLACGWLAHRGREAAAFGLSCALMLVASPLVDSHYFAFLIIPVGLAHRRLNAAWAVPVLLWVCPATHPEEWQIVLWWLCASSVVGASLRRLSLNSRTRADADANRSAGAPDSFPLPTTTELVA
jgi:hypothetical protein